jgi:transaldolase/glucose-6-phosphate isomerase
MTLSSQRADLPAAIEAAVRASLEDWRLNRKVQRLWDRDASLWTGSDEARWLGWLDAIDAAEPLLEPLDRLADDVRREGFTHALLLGMGGSSLCPEVLARTFGPQAGFPELLVLDSTVPAQIRAFERRIAIERTLFIVSSKSGTTLEPNILLQYFFARAAALFKEATGSRFVAVTDPGSRLEARARESAFRAIFHGDPTIGGRYSALSAFGLVPAAVMGLDVRDLRRRAALMARACGRDVAPASNPGVELGAILGCLGLLGRDKITLLPTPSLSGLGAWLEQLIAESTGKQGKGLIPIDGEEPGPPSEYGHDRVFVRIGLRSDPPDSSVTGRVDAIRAAGHPFITIELADGGDIVQEFVRWEIATAVAGSILGINPFDQPDVESSKEATRRLTAEYEATGRLGEPPALASDGTLALFTDARNREELVRAVGAAASPARYVQAHLDRLEPGDYFALLAYLEMHPVHQQLLQRVRSSVRRRAHVATAVEFGPRFLHSTGQAYKGGPPTGVFIQVTASDDEDVQVPGHEFTFGVVKAAQAQGDLNVLLERGRRALGLHIRGDLAFGLATLADIVDDWARRASPPDELAPTGR